VALLLQVAGEILLEREPGVVGPDRDPHHAPSAWAGTAP
jgi:hypothetical protein